MLNYFKVLFGTKSKTWNFDFIVIIIKLFCDSSTLHRAMQNCPNNEEWIVRTVVRKVQKELFFKFLAYFMQEIYLSAFLSAQNVIEFHSYSGEIKSEQFPNKKRQLTQFELWWLRMILHKTNSYKQSSSQISNFPCMSEFYGMSFSITTIRIEVIDVSNLGS